jgi:ABC-type transport system substrate-binding protein
VGTGPFMVECWRAARIELVANPHAWRVPRVERLELREILDPSTRLQGVQSGGLDIALHITPDDADALARVGVRMDIRPLAISQLIQQSVSGQRDGQAFHMEFDLKPSLEPMRAIPMHSCQRVTPWHCDEAVTPLIEAAQREFDPDRRLGLVREMMGVYHDDPSMLYLWESVFFDGVAARVRDYAPVNRRINYHAISVAR